MALWSLTHERVEVLRAELAAKEAELQALLKKSDPNPNPNPNPSNQALLKKSDPSPNPNPNPNPNQALLKKSPKQLWMEDLDAFEAGLQAREEQPSPWPEPWRQPWP